MFILKFKKVLMRINPRGFLPENIKCKACSSKAEDPKAKFAFKVTKDVEEKFLQNEFKAKVHPGIMNIKTVSLPLPLLESITRIKEEANYPTSMLERDSSSLMMYIWHRKPQPEDEQLRQALDTATINLIKKGTLPPSFLGNDQPKSIDDLTSREKVKLKGHLKNLVYNWAPLEFNEYTAFVYLWGRLSPDFASLVRIFAEIRKRKKDFRPQTLFDFGSGVGAGAWAVDEVWPSVCSEVYNVDSSAPMNALSELLLRGGQKDGPAPPRLKKTFYRQFLPASENLKYDLVVSSRTLFEIGNLNTRIRTADILWRKVNPGGFLVLVEAGTLEGYGLLLEVRDYLLEMSRLQREKYALDSPIHVFAPCPHDSFCPRFNHRSGRSCHFPVSYQPLGRPGPPSTDLFSYVVLQKEARKEEEDGYGWPRVVQPILKRHQHVVARACTPGGAIRELVSTRKRHGTPCHQLCRNTRWGDLLPIDLHKDDLETANGLDVPPTPGGDSDHDADRSASQLS